MALTVTMTEFNQNPSRVAKLAARDDVIVMRRGWPELRISRVTQSQNPLAELYESGLATPPRNGGKRGPLKTYNTDIDLGAALDQDRNKEIW